MRISEKELLKRIVGSKRKEITQRLRKVKE
jgi:hypothetical protein